MNSSNASQNTPITQDINGLVDLGVLEFHMKKIAAHLRGAVSSGPGKNAQEIFHFEEATEIRNNKARLLTKSFEGDQFGGTDDPDKILFKEYVEKGYITDSDLGMKPENNDYWESHYNDRI